MTRDHLTPEQRPTKDGNFVTRWVRRDKKKTAATGSIPAPGLPKEKTESQKLAEEFILKNQIAKDETPEQKAERKAKQKLQMGYVKAEGLLRWKYRKDDTIDDYEINDLFKHLNASATVDPKSIDEALLRGYSDFKNTLFRVDYEQRQAAGQDVMDVEASRPNTNKLGARYADHPEDRPYLKAIIETGVTDYDEVQETLRVVHENPDQFETILSFLENRSTPDGLGDYLDQKVTALRDGTL